LDNNASSKVPNDATNEQGHDDDINDNKTPSSNRKKDALLSKRHSTSQQLNTISDSASKMVTLATDLIISSKRQNDAESPKSKAHAKIDLLNKRQKLVLDDDCFSPFTKERIKSEIDAEKRSLGYILAGGSEIVARMPISRSFAGANIEMHQNSMFNDFDVSSSEE
jgi:hypothetical protein